MNYRGLYILPCLLATWAAAAEPPGDARHGASREITRGFASELKSALQQAMREDGPVGAIAVCQSQAPAIAARLSEENGVAVGRTSLKPRNPANTPRDWQREVLAHFEQRRAGSGAETPLEWFVTLPDGSARYMMAIDTQPLCLACHGEQLAPSVADALRARYPDDQATGYRLGDLRGAFWVDWPASPNPGH
ncbi:Tll0287-like domain-containing protein [Parahaliea mediterranea]|uniref:DUF3365 domain-containing protein n=1 Tax=Parahaliea mediterranea TaxID=651086 RepID=A0A939DK12_9GAMM|nr:DUF3365 domain-containing protein [Parahaliea mediterranea]MBN7798837.1 DUF3365 domain-containing protein [Parahaliea mediterranea]